MEHHVAGCVLDDIIWVGGTVIEQLHDFVHCAFGAVGLLAGKTSDGGQHGAINRVGIRPIYGAAVQLTATQDQSPPLSPAKKCIQEILDTLLMNCKGGWSRQKLHHQSAAFKPHMLHFPGF
jgi:hypothetical protein